MKWFKFYVNHAINYSPKSILVSFAFTNKKGELKESDGYFIPKKAIKEVNLIEKTITLAGWYYSKMGFIWRYRIDKAHAPPKELETQQSFEKNAPMFKNNVWHSLEGINVIK